MIQKTKIIRLYGKAKEKLKREVWERDDGE